MFEQARLEQAVPPAANRNSAAGINIGSAVGSVSEWLRRITVRVIASGQSHGSGVVWRAKGLIVTNAHVVGSPSSRPQFVRSEIGGGSYEVEFADGRKAQGWLVARDPKIDLAALAVGMHDLQAASIRKARTLRPGELMIAVGNPWDGAGAVSTGIVHHSVGKSSVLTADIRLAPGNSGGPLADAEGAVVGINSMIIDGFGVAVTSEAVEGFLKRSRLVEVV